MEYFKTEGLSVGYGGRPVIENINFEFNRGEIVTIIGPNGAGKSTLLKSIMKSLPALSGKVFLDGMDMKELPPPLTAKKLSVVLTDRISSELMTVRDVVATGRHPYTGRLGRLTGEDNAKIDRALKLVHIEAIADLPFRDLSDGQKQRVMLSRAICQEPELLLLDEITSYLDIHYKLELLTVIKQLVKSEGVSVIMTLHELDIAKQISDKIICVKAGRIDRVGNTDEIFGSGYIAELFGIKENEYDETLKVLVENVME